MFSSIKKTILNIQGVNSSDSTTANVYTERLISDVNEKWSNIHHTTLLNSSKATFIETQLPQLLVLLNKRYKDITNFTTFLSNLPDMTIKVGELLDSISSLESLFEETESALYLLEDICDQMDIQENKLNHRLKLAGYREEKKMELENIQADMDESYQTELARSRRQMNAQDRERCLRLEQAFLQQLDDCHNVGEESHLPAQLSLNPDKGDDPLMKIVDILTVDNKPLPPKPSHRTLPSEVILEEEEEGEDILGPTKHIVMQLLPPLSPKTTDKIDKNHENVEVPENISAELSDYVVSPKLRPVLDLKNEVLNEPARSRPDRNLSLDNKPSTDEDTLKGETSSLVSPSLDLGDLGNFKSLEDELKEVSLEIFDSAPIGSVKEGVTNHGTASKSAVMENGGILEDESSNEPLKMGSINIERESTSQSSDDFTQVSPPSEDLVIVD